MKVVAVCFLVALTGTAFAQAEPAVPILMQCELQQCGPQGRGGVWTFKGRQGLATWATGAAAYLQVERFEPSSVVIHRRDLPGSAGFGVIASATYTGTVRGTMLEGTVSWTTVDGKRDSGPFKARFHAPEQYAFAQQQAGSIFGRQFARDPNVLALDPKKTCTDELASHAEVDYAWLLGQVALGVKAGQTIWQGVQVVDLTPAPTDTADNFRRAACWFASAALQKHAGAQAALAVLLHEGRGVAKDDRMAYQWALAGGLKNDPAGKQVLAKFDAEGLQRTVPAAAAVRDEDIMISSVPMRFNQCQTLGMDANSAHPQHRAQGPRSPLQTPSPRAHCRSTPCAVVDAQLTGYPLKSEKVGIALQPVAVQAHLQAVADQARRGAVQDGAHGKGATARDARLFLDEVGGAPHRQVLQLLTLDAKRRRVAPVAAHHDLAHEALVGTAVFEVAVSAQQQVLLDADCAVAGLCRLRAGRNMPIPPPPV